jgi:hypothetical protein
VTSTQAKEILLLYRPGTADSADPEVAEALALAHQDPELACWLEQHRAFQAAMRASFRQIEVPAHLRTSLLIQQPVLPLPRKRRLPQVWWRNPIWLTATAVVLVLLSLLDIWLRPQVPNRFTNYESRMVGDAQRSYRMDIVTNDMQQVRRYLASQDAPADYVLPQGLEHLKLTGGGRLTWRSNPVAMVCFDRGDKQMLFLFVMKRTAVKDPPPTTPEYSKVRQMAAVRWTRGDNTYVLAGPEEADFLKKYQ